MKELPQRSKIPFSVFRIFASNNQITHISQEWLNDPYYWPDSSEFMSPELFQKKSISVYLDGNKLCDLNQAEKDWIEQYSASGKKTFDTQLCE